VRRTRVPHLILAAVASYELRGLLTSLTHAVSLISCARSSPPLWLGALLALGLGAVLFQAGRGLHRVARAPRWTLALIGLWLMLCSALLVLFSIAGAVAGGGLTSHSLASHALALDGPWAGAPAMLALILSASIAGTGWLARRPLNFGISLAPATVRDLARRLGVARARQPGPPPLLAGWSGRGPPARLSPQTL
jgi:hypothetical protein